MLWEKSICSCPEQLTGSLPGIYSGLKTDAEEEMIRCTDAERMR